MKCSKQSCNNQTDETHKLCEKHISYHNKKKFEYRLRPKREGQCSEQDCPREARPGLRLCQHCAFRKGLNDKKPERRKKIAIRNQKIQEEVLSFYGKKCACCGTDKVEFLSIDHIEGFNGIGPRKGSPLYRWLKRNNFPPGFRVLCMSCNFALGHHGYCPHGNLNQKCITGRPKVKNTDPNIIKKRREYWIKYKQKVFSYYGGFICSCCGEENHECLSLDHIDNNGALHRKELNGDARDGRNLYVWLKQNNYPSGFQVLCMNCNFAKGHFKICPHTSEGPIIQAV